jgi:hypothetical protein
MTQHQAAARPARARPEEPEQQTGAACPLVLELILAATEPPTGTVRAAGAEAPVAFHGWIDLMAAISSLGVRSRAEPGLPGVDSSR